MTDMELQAALKAMSELALLARIYFNELVGQGFKEAQAMQLTVSFINTTIQPKPDQAPPSRFGNLNFM